MADRTVYHVLPHDDGWQVKKAGGERASSVHSTKAEAVSAGKELAKGAALGQIKIHKADGTIETEHTYGDDPPSSKG